MTAARDPEVPEDVAAAIAADTAAQRRWDALPPSHRREHLGYIDEAKKADTRSRRIARTVETLAAEA